MKAHLKRMTPVVVSLFFAAAGAPYLNARLPTTFTHMSTTVS